MPDNELTIHQKLTVIQQTLKAPKNQFNSFGKYHYRSCEDILEGVKPLLGNLILTISDEIINIGDRYYVKANLTLTDGKAFIFISAYAREEADKKGMDSSQITGAASSYARKYALNGLFLIDDSKDADTQDNTKQDKKTDKNAEDKPKNLTFEELVEKMQNSVNIFELEARAKKYKPDFNFLNAEEQVKVKEAKAIRKTELEDTNADN
jgi:hypothetical protein